MEQQRTETPPARQRRASMAVLRLRLLVAAAIAAIFAIDATTLGIQVWILYLAVLLLATALPGRDEVLLVAGACTLATVAGHVLMPPAADAVSLAIVNRGLLVLALWIVTFIALRGRRTEASLAEEQRFRALLESAPDAMVIVDASGRIVLVNSQTEALFGYDRHDLLGQPVERLIPAHLGERHRAHRADYAAAPRARNMGTGLELEGLRRDGTTFPVEIALGPLRSEEGMLVSAAIRDIGDRKRTERALRESEEALRAADRRKDDFLATLGHELRNPLAAVRNAVRVLRHPAVGAAQAEWGRAVIEAQSRQMARLIDDLLDVGRIARNAIELRRGRVELAELLRLVEASARGLVEERGHELRLDLPREDLHLEADAARLTQVFANLLDNAVKYTPPGGRISVTAGREGDTAVVRVQDTGIGLTADALPHVFEMFFRADRSLEQSQSGLGVGLTLAHQLVRLHGGTLEARSPGAGAGSEFTVRLPALAAAPPRPAAAPAVAPGPSPRRILVVDDNRQAADSLAVLLRLDGHEVATAYDGLEAVAVAEQYRPHLALLDIGMPNLNGYEAARRIRDLPASAHTRLVALTGWGQEEDRRRAAEAGFDSHLVKPVDPEALDRLLRDVPATPA
jgi:PAS domain S-box-containing protein